MTRRTKRARSATAALALIVLAAPAVARAWGTAEHLEVGTASYRGACEIVERAIAKLAPDAGARQRFDMACGSLDQMARLYGDGTAVAGDYVGHSSELFAPSGAWRFSSRTHYYWLALENSEHFNPFSTESWREFHGTALADALRAATAEGLPRIDAWVKALRENAYADHLLQDSFAAGHMGFNRRASSAAAAKSFHDYWNARGRAVTDRGGQSWITYGDGRLNTEANAGGRKHLLDAATSSVRDLVMTFVLARRIPDDEIATWRMLPFTIEAPELLVDTAELIERRATTRYNQQVPLAAAVLPARKNTVGHARVWAAAPFSGSDDPLVAATANVELAIPVLPAQASFGAGGTLSQPNGKHAAVADFGLLGPLLLTFDGLLSHEVEAGVSVLFGKPTSTLLRLEYQLNVELGDALLMLNGGLVEFLPDPRTGWFAAAGLGWVFSAAGGGAFQR